MKTHINSIAAAVVAGATCYKAALHISDVQSNMRRASSCYEQSPNVFQPVQLDLGSVPCIAAQYQNFDVRRAEGK